MTDNFRVASWVLWFVVVLAAVAGWMFFGKDPSQLAPVIGWVTAGPFIGEAANIGKRATYKKDHHENGQ